MKKQISPAIIIGAIVGLVAVIALAVFFAVKSDPASQAPNEPPRFDPAAKEAESRASQGTDRAPAPQ